MALLTTMAAVGLRLKWLMVRVKTVLLGPVSLILLDMTMLVSWLTMGVVVWVMVKPLVD